MTARDTVFISTQSPRHPRRQESRGPRHLPVPAIIFRWTSLALAVMLAFFDPDIGTYTAIEATAVAVALVAGLALMEQWAFQYRGLTEAVILVELTVTALLVAFTGSWSSPFLLFAFAPVLDAGFLTGLRSAIAVALLAALGPLMASVVADGGIQAGSARLAAVWAFCYLVSSVIASYARRQAMALATSRLMLATERKESAARLATMEDANDLLTDLHEVAQILPATLDLEGLVQTTLSRLQELFPAKTCAMLFSDGKEVRVLGARGAVLPVASTPIQESPPAVQIALDRPIAAGHLSEGTGLDPVARSILYAPLVRGDTTRGLLVLEDDDPERFGNDDISLLVGFAGPVAVALENAQLFSRLRTLATSEERTRIARELHDRTAQHLAAIAFELDRLGHVAQRPATELAATGVVGATASELANEIDGLAVEIRRAIEELRNAIGDLRTDVTEAKGLAELIQEHAAGVVDRAGFDVQLALPPPGVRLPIPQERELWRIFQEAVGNVIKHANATTLQVSYQVDHETVDLLIEDDGCGFNPRGRKLGHFGLTGMAERAEAIGASFSVKPREPRGTRVKVSLRRKT